MPPLARDTSVARDPGAPRRPPRGAMVTPVDRRADAARVLEVARATTDLPLITDVVQAGRRTGVFIGVETTDMVEARRLHVALLELCEREKLGVDVIVVAGG